jgi:hypothetical protein
MCTAGTCGFCICATRLMPEAQKRGSSSMPGDALARGHRLLRPFAQRAVDGRDVDADLLEHAAAAHHAHQPAAGIRAVLGLRRVSVTSNRPGAVSAKGPGRSGCPPAPRRRRRSRRASSRNQAEARRDSCEATARRDLADFDALIARTEAELARGYRVEEVALPFTYDARCPDAEVAPGARAPRCTFTDVRYETRREAIDPADWQARLANLRAKRAQAVERAEAALEECAARWPQ